MGFGAVGLVLIAIGAVGPEWGALAIGAYFVAVSLWVTLVPSRSVVIDRQGRAVFCRRGRTLVVEPGELEAIKTPLFANANRWLPLVVKARQGKLHFKPPVGTCGELWTALAEVNPSARLVDPHPWLGR